MKYLSVCSGIEAATAAWHPLGWQPVGFAEIEKFPAAVLAHHYPNVPNFGDMTKFKEWPDADVDVLVGGTPCQSFSVAGLRKGMADPRGNLALTYLAIADRYRPEWLLWENVPGVLSSNGGRDFGAILGGMVELGYGFAYRVLDAQYVRVDGFGRAVPQRRRRVFVVGNSRDWRRAAAVLFERESLSGNSAPRRKAGQGFTADIAPSIVSSGRGVERAGDTRGQDPVVAIPFGGNNTAGPIDVATACNAHGGPAGRLDFESETFVAFDTTQITSKANRSVPKAGDPCHPLAAGAHPPAIAFSCKDSGGDASDNISPTPRAGGFASSHANAGVMPAIAFAQNQRDEVRLMEVAGAIAAEPGMKQQTYVSTNWAVRRLTPTECERLQGFPDSFTNVPWRGKNGAPDGPRYKALGNSMAVNAMRWLGTRIQIVSELAAPKLEAAE